MDVTDNMLNESRVNHPKGRAKCLESPLGPYRLRSFTQRSSWARPRNFVKNC